jgi:hypothetical protein
MTSSLVWRLFFLLLPCSLRKAPAGRYEKLAKQLSQNPSPLEQERSFSFLSILAGAGRLEWTADISDAVAALQ